MDESTQVFIVRVWAEPRESEAAPSEGRVTVQHVASGDRSSYTDLDDILTFIRNHLDDAE